MGKLNRICAWFAVVIVVVAVVGPLWAEDAGKININTASVEELKQLDQIGPKYAERIIEFREKNGPFKQPEDIMQVPGIGPKAYEANKDRMVVE